MNTRDEDSGSQSRREAIEESIRKNLLSRQKNQSQAVVSNPPVEIKNKRKEKFDDGRVMSPVVAQAADPSDFDKYESEFKVLDETDAN